ncbi:MAG: HAMP domain-containing sensor histidine kinase [Actinomycetota bacterium]|nr:HAMP domain-containing sensor histidine kinase [Actinomycetota bacterium]
MWLSLPQSDSRTRVYVPWYAILAFAIIATSAIVVIFGGSDARSIAGSIGVFAGNLTAGFIFIRRAQPLESAERRAWTLVGIGLTIASTGIIVLAVWFLIAGDAPTFSPVDLFFIVGYSTALIGFAMLPHTAGNLLQRTRTAFDGIIGAIAIGALVWVLLLLPIVEGLSGAETWERIIASLYPLVDLAVVVIIMMVTVRRSNYRFDLRMLLFTAAVLAQTIGDVSYLVAGVGRSFGAAEPLFLVFLVASALFLSTSLIVDRVPEPKQYADRRLPLWSILAPYTSAALMVGVLVVRLWDSDIDQGDRILLVASLAVAMLVIGRQGIAIRENRMIVERQRTELVSSISHELRTPLTAMVGFLAVLQEDPKLHLEERIEMIEVVVDQATYLERIIEDLLLLAHDDPSRIGLSVSERDIAAIVESSLHAATIDPSSVTVEVEPGLSAIVDGGRLQQVLVNLLSNARRYGGDQCLVIARDDGGRLIIEVHDSGLGVPKKHEIMIWERFERGPNRYNAAVPGSGIGLAMVRAIAEAHGGRATYRSSDRLGGACFTIDLPGRVGKRETNLVAPSTTMAIG